MTHYTINTNDKVKKKMQPIHASISLCFPLKGLSKNETNRLNISETALTVEIIYSDKMAEFTIYKKENIISYNLLCPDMLSIKEINEGLILQGNPPLISWNIREYEIPLLATNLCPGIFALDLSELLELAEIEWLIAQILYELYFKIKNKKEVKKRPT